MHILVNETETRHCTSIAARSRCIRRCIDENHTQNAVGLGLWKQTRVNICFPTPEFIIVHSRNKSRRDTTNSVPSRDLPSPTQLLRRNRGIAEEKMMTTRQNLYPIFRWEGPLPGTLYDPLEDSKDFTSLGVLCVFSVVVDWRSFNRRYCIRNYYAVRSTLFSGFRWKTLLCWEMGRSWRWKCADEWKSLQ